MATGKSTKKAAKKAAKPAAKRRAAARGAAAGDDRARAYRAAFDLAAALGWRHVTMADIAAEAGLSLAALYGEFRSRGALLAGFTRHVDETVLGGDFADLAGEAPKDRLFDVVMRRLDALAPYKEGLAAVVRDAGADPVAVLCGACRVERSMAWMLEAAGLAASGLGGRLRAKGLTLIWANTLRVWLRDDSEDMARTMAALDRMLSRADDLMARRFPAPLRRPGAAGATA